MMDEEGAMEQEEAREKPEIVVSYGGRRSWSFPAGTLVSDAIRVIRGGETNKDNMVLQAVVDGIVLHLPGGFLLQANQGWQYQVTGHVMLPRRFGAGHAVNPNEFYYLMPRGLERLVKELRMGKSCVLCDRRQSGKTTLAFAVAKELKEGNISAVYVQGMGAARQSWDASTMWTCLCEYLHLANPTLFSKPADGAAGTDRMFLSYFLKRNLATPVTLILDEADSLLLLPADCLDELFHTIRNMKNDSSSYNLNGFLLVGVETVKDLLEGHYKRRKAESEASNVDYVPGSSPSRLSPFPHDHTVASSGFNVADIVELLQQANVDNLGMIHDVPQIATCIWEWTSGHKGLVGTCLAFMMQEEAFTYRAWLQLSDSSKLARYVFGKATYSRMVQCFRACSHTQHDLLASFLEAEEHVFQSVGHIRDLLAEGVLVAREHELDYYVSISSPMLRSHILRCCSILNQLVDKPPGSQSAVDRSWVIQETIRTLDGQTVCPPECRNASGSSSEYALQFAFMSRIKAVLQHAYPKVGALVLPEVKAVVAEGSRCSRLRLDTLVRDKDQFPKFGFEFLVEGKHDDVLHHYQKAVVYARQHSAQVYLVHFAMDKEPEEIQPADDNIFFWAVRFDQAHQVAVVHTLECTGAREEHVLRLKSWTGRFCFDDLV